MPRAKGFHHSDETKKKLSEAKEGTILSFETRQKMSESHKNTSYRGPKHHNWNGGKSVKRQGYVMVKSPNHPRASRGYVFEHILIAEKVLGHPLPRGVVIHHHPSIKNATDLIICESDAYHRVLHQRMRALNACGHSNWRKCKYCKQYDQPQNVSNSYHKVCAIQYERNRYYNKKHYPNLFLS